MASATAMPLSSPSPPPPPPMASQQQQQQQQQEMQRIVLQQQYQQYLQLQLQAQYNQQQQQKPRAGSGGGAGGGVSGNANTNINGAASMASTTGNGLPPQPSSSLASPPFLSSSMSQQNNNINNNANAAQRPIATTSLAGTQPPTSTIGGVGGGRMMMPVVSPFPTPVASLTQLPMRQAQPQQSQQFGFAPSPSFFPIAVGPKSIPPPPSPMMSGVVGVVGGSNARENSSRSVSPAAKAPSSSGGGKKKIVVVRKKTVGHKNASTSDAEMSASRSTSPAKATTTPPATATTSPAKSVGAVKVPSPAGPPLPSTTTAASVPSSAAAAPPLPPPPAPTPSAESPARRPSPRMVKTSTTIAANKATTAAPPHPPPHPPAAGGGGGVSGGASPSPTPATAANANTNVAPLASAAAANGKGLGVPPANLSVSSSAPPQPSIVAVKTLPAPAAVNSTTNEALLTAAAMASKRPASPPRTAPPPAAAAAVNATLQQRTTSPQKATPTTAAAVATAIPSPPAEVKKKKIVIVKRRSPTSSPARRTAVVSPARSSSAGTSVSGNVAAAAAVTVPSATGNGNAVVAVPSGPTTASGRAQQPQQPSVSNTSKAPPPPAASPSASSSASPPTTVTATAARTNTNATPAALVAKGQDAPVMMQTPRSSTASPAISPAKTTTPQPTATAAAMHQQTQGQAGDGVKGNASAAPATTTATPTGALPPASSPPPSHSILVNTNTNRSVSPSQSRQHIVTFVSANSDGKAAPPGGAAAAVTTAPLQPTTLPPTSATATVTANAVVPAAQPPVGGVPQQTKPKQTVPVAATPLPPPTATPVVSATPTAAPQPAPTSAPTLAPASPSPAKSPPKRINRIIKVFKNSSRKSSPGASTATTPSVSPARPNTNKSINAAPLLSPSAQPAAAAVAVLSSSAPSSQRASGRRGGGGGGGGAAVAAAKVSTPSVATTTTAPLPATVATTAPLSSANNKEEPQKQKKIAIAGSSPQKVTAVVAPSNSVALTPKPTTTAATPAAVVVGAVPSVPAPSPAVITSSTQGMNAADLSLSNNNNNVAIAHPSPSASPSLPSPAITQAATPPVAAAGATQHKKKKTVSSSTGGSPPRTPSPPLPPTPAKPLPSSSSLPLPAAALPSAPQQRQSHNQDQQQQQHHPPAATAAADHSSMSSTPPEKKKGIAKYITPNDLIAFKGLIDVSPALAKEVLRQEEERATADGLTSKREKHHSVEDIVVSPETPIETHAQAAVRGDKKTLASSSSPPSPHSANTTNTTTTAVVVNENARRLREMMMLRGNMMSKLGGYSSASSSENGETENGAAEMRARGNGAKGATVAKSVHNTSVGVSSAVSPHHHQHHHDPSSPHHHHHAPTASVGTPTPSNQMDAEAKRKDEEEEANKRKKALEKAQHKEEKKEAKRRLKEKEEEAERERAAAAEKEATMQHNDEDDDEKKNSSRSRSHLTSLFPLSNGSGKKKGATPIDQHHQHRHSSNSAPLRSHHHRDSCDNPPPQPLIGLAPKASTATPHQARRLGGVDDAVDDDVPLSRRSMFRSTGSEKAVAISNNSSRYHGTSGGTERPPPPPSHSRRGSGPDLTMGAREALRRAAESGGPRMPRSVPLEGVEEGYAHRYHDHAEEDYGGEDYDHDGEHHHYHDRHHDDLHDAYDYATYQQQYDTQHPKDAFSFDSNNETAADAPYSRPPYDHASYPHPPSSSSTLYMPQPHHAAHAAGARRSPFTAVDDNKSSMMNISTTRQATPRRSPGNAEQGPRFGNSSEYHQPPQPHQQHQQRRHDDAHRYSFDSNKNRGPTGTGGASSSSAAYHGEQYGAPIPPSSLSSPHRQQQNIVSGTPIRLSRAAEEWRAQKTNNNSDMTSHANTPTNRSYHRDLVDDRRYMYSHQQHQQGGNGGEGEGEGQYPLAAAAAFDDSSYEVATLRLPRLRSREREERSICTTAPLPAAMPLPSSLRLTAAPPSQRLHLSATHASPQQQQRSHSYSNNSNPRTTFDPINKNTHANPSHNATKRGDVERRRRRSGEDGGRTQKSLPRGNASYPNGDEDDDDGDGDYSSATGGTPPGKGKSYNNRRDDMHDDDLDDNDADAYSDAEESVDRTNNGIDRGGVVQSQSYSQRNGKEAKKKRKQVIPRNDNGHRIDGEGRRDEGAKVDESIMIVEAPYFDTEEELEAYRQYVLRQRQKSKPRAGMANEVIENNMEASPIEEDGQSKGKGKQRNSEPAAAMSGRVPHSAEHGGSGGGGKQEDAGANSRGAGDGASHGDHNRNNNAGNQSHADRSGHQKAGGNNKQNKKKGGAAKSNSGGSASPPPPPPPLPTPFLVQKRARELLFCWRFGTFIFGLVLFFIFAAFCLLVSGGLMDRWVGFRNERAIGISMSQGLTATAAVRGGSATSIASPFPSRGDVSFLSNMVFSSSSSSSSPFIFSSLVNATEASLWCNGWTSDDNRSSLTTATLATATAITAASVGGWVVPTDLSTAALTCFEAYGLAARGFLPSPHNADEANAAGGTTSSSSSSPSYGTVQFNQFMSSALLVPDFGVTTGYLSVCREGGMSFDECGLRWKRNNDGDDGSSSASGEGSSDSDIFASSFKGLVSGVAVPSPSSSASSSSLIEDYFLNRSLLATSNNNASHHTASASAADLLRRSTFAAVMATSLRHRHNHLTDASSTLSSFIERIDDRIAFYSSGNASSSLLLLDTSILDALTTLRSTIVTTNATLLPLMRGEVDRLSNVLRYTAIVAGASVPSAVGFWSRSVWDSLYGRRRQADSGDESEDVVLVPSTRATRQEEANGNVTNDSNSSSSSSAGTAYLSSLPSDPLARTLAALLDPLGRVARDVVLALLVNNTDTIITNVSSDVLSDRDAFEDLLNTILGLVIAENETEEGITSSPSPPSSRTPLRLNPNASFVMSAYRSLANGKQCQRGYNQLPNNGLGHLVRRFVMGVVSNQYIKTYTHADEDNNKTSSSPSTTMIVSEFNVTQTASDPPLTQFYTTADDEAHDGVLGLSAYGAEVLHYIGVVTFVVGCAFLLLAILFLIRVIYIRMKMQLISRRALAYAAAPHLYAPIHAYSNARTARGSNADRHANDQNCDNTVSQGRTAGGTATASSSAALTIFSPIEGDDDDDEGKTPASSPTVKYAARVSDYPDGADDSAESIAVMGKVMVLSVLIGQGLIVRGRGGGRIGKKKNKRAEDTEQPWSALSHKRTIHHEADANGNPIRPPPPTITVRQFKALLRSYTVGRFGFFITFGIGLLLILFAIVCVMALANETPLYFCLEGYFDDRFIDLEREGGLWDSRDVHSIMGGSGSEPPSSVLTLSFGDAASKLVPISSSASSPPSPFFTERFTYAYSVGPSNAVPTDNSAAANAAAVASSSPPSSSSPLYVREDFLVTGGGGREFSNPPSSLADCSFELSTARKGINGMFFLNTRQSAVDPIKGASVNVYGESISKDFTTITAAAPSSSSVALSKATRMVSLRTKNSNSAGGHPYAAYQSSISRLHLALTLLDTYRANEGNPVWLYLSSKVGEVTARGAEALEALDRIEKLRALTTAAASASSAAKAEGVKQQMAERRFAVANDYETTATAANATTALLLETETDDTALDYSTTTTEEDREKEANNATTSADDNTSANDDSPPPPTQPTSTPTSTPQALYEAYTSFLTAVAIASIGADDALLLGMSSGTNRTTANTTCSGGGKVFFNVSTAIEELFDPSSTTATMKMESIASKARGMQSSSTTEDGSNNTLFVNASQSISAYVGLPRLSMLLYGAKASANLARMARAVSRAVSITTTRTTTTATMGQEEGASSKRSGDFAAYRSALEAAALRIGTATREDVLREDDRVALWFTAINVDEEALLEAVTPPSASNVSTTTTTSGSSVLSFRTFAFAPPQRLVPPNLLYWIPLVSIPLTSRDVAFGYSGQQKDDYDKGQRPTVSAPTTNTIEGTIIAKALLSGIYNDGKGEGTTTTTTIYISNVSRRNVSQPAGDGNGTNTSSSPSVSFSFLSLPPPTKTLTVRMMSFDEATAAMASTAVLSSAGVGATGARDLSTSSSSSLSSSRGMQQQEDLSSPSSASSFFLPTRNYYASNLHDAQMGPSAYVAYFALFLLLFVVLVLIPLCMVPKRLVELIKARQYRDDRLAVASGQVRDDAFRTRPVSGIFRTPSGGRHHNHHHDNNETAASGDESGSNGGGASYHQQRSSSPNSNSRVAAANRSEGEDGEGEDKIVIVAHADANPRSTLAAAMVLDKTTNRYVFSDTLRREEVRRRYLEKMKLHREQRQQQREGEEGGGEEEDFPPSAGLSRNVSFALTSYNVPPFYGTAIGMAQKRGDTEEVARLLARKGRGGGGGGGGGAASSSCESDGENKNSKDLLHPATTQKVRAAGGSVINDTDNANDSEKTHHHNHSASTNPPPPREPEEEEEKEEATMEAENKLDNETSSAPATSTSKPLPQQAQQRGRKEMVTSAGALRSRSWTDAVVSPITSAAELSEDEDDNNDGDASNKPAPVKAGQIVVGDDGIEYEYYYDSQDDEGADGEAGAAKKTQQRPDGGKKRQSRSASANNVPESHDPFHHHNGDDDDDYGSDRRGGVSDRSNSPPSVSSYAVTSRAHALEATAMATRFTEKLDRTHRRVLAYHNDWLNRHAGPMLDLIVAETFCRQHLLKRYVRSIHKWLLYAKANNNIVEAQNREDMALFKEREQQQKMKEKGAPAADNDDGDAIATSRALVLFDESTANANANANSAHHTSPPPPPSLRSSDNERRAAAEKELYQQLISERERIVGRLNAIAEEEKARQVQRATKEKENEDADAKKEDSSTARVVVDAEDEGGKDAENDTDTANKNALALVTSSLASPDQLALHEEQMRLTNTLETIDHTMARLEKRAARRRRKAEREREAKEAEAEAERQQKGEDANTSPPHLPDSAGVKLLLQYWEARLTDLYSTSAATMRTTMVTTKSASTDPYGDHDTMMGSNSNAWLYQLFGPHAADVLLMTEGFTDASPARTQRLHALRNGRSPSQQQQHEPQPQHHQQEQEAHSGGDAGAGGGNADASLQPPPPPSPSRQTAIAARNPLTSPPRRREGGGGEGGVANANLAVVNDYEDDDAFAYVSDMSNNNSPLQHLVPTPRSPCSAEASPHRGHTKQGNDKDEKDDDDGGEGKMMMNGSSPVRLLLTMRGDDGGDGVSGGDAMEEAIAAASAVVGSTAEPQRWSAEWARRYPLSTPPLPLEQHAKEAAPPGAAVVPQPHRSYYAPIATYSANYLSATYTTATPRTQAASPPAATTVVVAANDSKSIVAIAATTPPASTRPTDNNRNASQSVNNNTDDLYYPPLPNAIVTTPITSVNARKHQNGTAPPTASKAADGVDDDAKIDKILAAAKSIAALAAEQLEDDHIVMLTLPTSPKETEGAGKRDHSTPDKKRGKKKASALAVSSKSDEKDSQRQTLLKATLQHTRQQQQQYNSSSAVQSLSPSHARSPQRHQAKEVVSSPPTFDELAMKARALGLGEYEDDAREDDDDDYGNYHDGGEDDVYDDDDYGGGDAHNDDAYNDFASEATKERLLRLVLSNTTIGAANPSYSYSLPRQPVDSYHNSTHHRREHDDGKGAAKRFPSANSTFTNHYGSARHADASLASLNQDHQHTENNNSTAQSKKVCLAPTAKSKKVYLAPTAQSKKVYLAPTAQSKKVYLAPTAQSLLDKRDGVVTPSRKAPTLSEQMKKKSSDVRDALAHSYSDGNL